MTDVYDERWDNLAKEIIHRAIMDWRILIYRNSTRKVKQGFHISLKEIELFLKSDYCKALVDIDPVIILNQLELEKELKGDFNNGEN